eukprot:scaffold297367_cov35-Tisochrysis_lutea.AAC.3
MKRQKETQAARAEHDYKPGGEDAPSRGVAGACASSALVKCATIACACRAAGVLCTSACHDGRRSLRCVRMSGFASDDARSASDSVGSSARGQVDSGDPQSEILSELSCCCCEECE